MLPVDDTEADADPGRTGMDARWPARCSPSPSACTTRGCPPRDRPGGARLCPTLSLEGVPASDDGEDPEIGFLHDPDVAAVVLPAET